VGSLAAIPSSDDQRLASTDGGQRANTGIGTTRNACQGTCDTSRGAHQLVFEENYTASCSAGFQIQDCANGSSWRTAFTVGSGTRAPAPPVGGQPLSPRKPGLSCCAKPLADRQPTRSGAAEVAQISCKA